MFVPTTTLTQVALATVSVFATSAITAVITSFVLEAIYENGVRSILQRRWVTKWLGDVLWQAQPAVDPSMTKQAIHEIEYGPWMATHGKPFGGSPFTMAPLFSLPHAQLSGQIATKAQALAEVSAPSALARALATAGGGLGAESVADRREALGGAIERAVDSIQLMLAIRWRQVDYLLSFTLALIIVSSMIKLLRPEMPTELPIGFYMGIALLAMILVPFVRIYVERAASTRY